MSTTKKVALVIAGAGVIKFGGLVIFNLLWAKRRREWLSQQQPYPNFTKGPFHE